MITQVIKTSDRAAVEAAGGAFVYIGRGGRHGRPAHPLANPFRLANPGDDAERLECVTKYARWLMEQPELVAQAEQLHGRVLGCWCAPLLCHGHIIAALAGEAHRWTEAVEGLPGPYATALEIVRFTAGQIRAGS